MIPRFALSLLVGTLLAAAALPAERTRPAAPDWPGEAGLRAHLADRQKASGRTGTSTERSRSPGGVTRSGEPAAAGGGAPASSSAVAVPANGDTVPKARPLTAREIAALQAVAARERAAIDRQPPPFTFRWPNRSQPPLGWAVRTREFDGIAVRRSQLRTPQNDLEGRLLEGYQTLSLEESGEGVGLVLVHSARPSVRLEFYTFGDRRFLPNLDAATVKAYQNALPGFFDDIPAMPVDLSESRHGFGPNVADKQSRRVRFRLYPEASGKEPEGPAVEGADFLVPLENEWLVVRFLAPADLFASALEPVESFLRSLAPDQPAMVASTRR